MRTFIKFLAKLRGFYKFYKDYEYDGEVARFIIENYQDVLQNRTELMSKPTYYAKDVIGQIDKWYEENPEYEKGFKALGTIEEIEHFLEVEICQTEERLKEPCHMFDGVEVSAEQAQKLNKSHIRFCKGILRKKEKSEG